MEETQENFSINNESIQENRNFPSSGVITKEEFEQRQKNKSPLGFSFNLVKVGKDEKSKYHANFFVHDGQVDISVNAPFDLVNGLSEEDKDKFDISPDGTTISYPKKGIEIGLGENESKTEKDKDYCIEGISRRYFGEDERNAKEISVEEMSKMICDAKGEEIIFYTGAGISLGGESPVWDTSTLAKELHLEGMYEQNQQGALETFLPAFTENPEVIAEKFNQFNDQLYANKSTSAHVAIANILETKPVSVIFTENVDLKHEAEGSRRYAVHMDSRKETFDIVRKRAQFAKLLITVGLSQDDRAVIAYLKDKNPDLKIVAFTLPPKHKGDVPSYLKDDFVVFGDCQELLPQTADLVKQLESQD